MSASSPPVAVRASQSPRRDGTKPARLFHAALGKSSGQDFTARDAPDPLNTLPFGGGAAGSSSPLPAICYMNPPITSSISIIQTLLVFFFFKKKKVFATLKN